jgi:two-component system, NtrC family, response regulator
MHLPASIRARVKQKSMATPPPPAAGQPDPVPPCRTGPRPLPGPELPTAPAGGGGSLPTLKQAREESITAMERRYLLDLLPRTQGDLARAAEIAGLSRSQLYRLLQKHKLSWRTGP